MGKKLRSKVYKCKKCEWKGEHPNYREVNPDYDVGFEDSKKKPSCPICGEWVK